VFDLQGHSIPSKKPFLAAEMYPGLPIAPGGVIRNTPEPFGVVLLLPLPLLLLLLLLLMRWRQ
jgi:hypothetical protein